MTTQPPQRRYLTVDEDSARWESFPFRSGDIVISTRSKSGTTWMQMICALLIFRSPELPEPLAVLSPWLDHLIAPIDDVVASLEAQQHRRFIKTHTPLDGLPWDDRVTYIVVARHPLDAAVSLYHQGNNLNRKRMAELMGLDPQRVNRARPDLETWLHEWVHTDEPAQENLDTLPGFMWHLTDAWNRRNEPNVMLAHYADLAADLASEMQRLAAGLDIEIDPAEVVQLAPAATFDAMRRRSATTAPDAVGVFRSSDAFFRGGRFGDGAAALDAEDLAVYEQRTAELAPADLLAWLHR